MDNRDSSRQPEGAEALKQEEESRPFVSPGIWQLAFPSILGNLSYSVVAMVQTKFVRRVGAGRPGGRRRRPAGVLCDAGDPDGGERRYHGPRRPCLGRRGLPGGEPRHHGIAGACGHLLAGGHGGGRSLRAPHQRHVRARPGYPGPGRGEHPHVELVQPRVCRHFHSERCASCLRRRLVAALDRHCP